MELTNKELQNSVFDELLDYLELIDQKLVNHVEEHIGIYVEQQQRNIKTISNNLHKIENIYDHNIIDIAL
ncbi:hypothetical protein [Bacillus sp. SM2101]|uniref:hypothetical protein n=1 Tax=Bacillaceae TaxID=186817 RepID=UPI001BDE31C3|nr:hypothetical protein [Bacillus sp. SM2101]